MLARQCRTVLKESTDGVDLTVLVCSELINR